jgi:hypothetical protein
MAPGQVINRLPDPPGGVGRELVAAPVLELVDRLHPAPAGICAGGLAPARA